MEDNKLRKSKKKKVIVERYFQRSRDKTGSRASKCLIFGPQVLPRRYNESTCDALSSSTTRLISCIRLLFLSFGRVQPLALSTPAQCGASSHHEPESLSLADDPSCHCQLDSEGEANVHVARRGLPKSRAENVPYWPYAIFRMLIRSGTRGSHGCSPRLRRT